MISSRSISTDWYYSSEFSHKGFPPQVCYLTPCNCRYQRHNIGPWKYKTQDFPLNCDWYILFLIRYIDYPWMMPRQDPENPQACLLEWCSFFSDLTRDTSFTSWECSPQISVSCVWWNLVCFKYVIACFTVFLLTHDLAVLLSHWSYGNAEDFFLTRNWS